MKKNRILNLRVSLPRYLLITKRKAVTLQWKHLADTTLTKWSRLTSPLIRYSAIMCPLIWYTEKYPSLLWYSCQNTEPQLIRRKQQTNPNWGIFYKITDRYSSKVSKLWTSKDWGTIKDSRRLKKHNNYMQCRNLEKNIGGKTTENQIKPVI